MGLKQHPAIYLCSIEKDFIAFQVKLKYLEIQGYFQDDFMENAAYQLTLPAAASERVDFLLKKFPSFKQEKILDGRIILSINKEKIKKDNDKDEEHAFTKEIKAIIASSPNLRRSVIGDDYLKELLFVTYKVICQNEETIKNLTQDSAFYSVLKYHSLFFDSKKPDQTYINYLKCAMLFFQKIIAAKVCDDDPYFCSIFINFSTVIVRLKLVDVDFYSTFLSTLKQTDEYIAPTAACIDTIINSKLENNSIEKLISNFDISIKRILDSNDKNDIVLERKLFFITKYCELISFLNKNSTSKNPIKKETAEEFKNYIELALEYLELLGKHYHLYKQYQSSILYFKKECENIFTKYYPPKKEEIILPQREKRKKPTPADFPVLLEKEASIEDINAKLERIRAAEKAEELANKKDQDYYLALRKQRAAEKKVAALAPHSPSPPPTPPPCEKYTEEQLRNIYLIPQNVKVIMLEHPGSPTGTYWGYFDLTEEDFADLQEYEFFFNKFNEGRVRNNLSHTGIVCINEHYYLRNPNMGTRVHAIVYTQENAPVLLRFCSVFNHKAHVQVLNAPAPVEQNLTALLG